MTRLTLTFAFILGLAPAAAPAHAAEGRSGCTGFITSLPATITAAGVWCLDRNLSTAITSGAAIEIAANNVTLDCNDHVIAATAQAWYGVRIADRLNATVRHCTLRGFHYGVLATGGDGGAHRVEDNRIEDSIAVGIWLDGAHNLALRNLVTHTGFVDPNRSNTGIWIWGDAVDNTVSGLFADEASVIGIQLLGDGSQARGNLVRDIFRDSEGYGAGLVLSGAQQVAVDNRLSATWGLVGIHGIDARAPGALCRGNTLTHWLVPLNGCAYAPENLLQ